MQHVCLMHLVHRLRSIIRHLQLPSVDLLDRWQMLEVCHLLLITAWFGNIAVGMLLRLLFIYLLFRLSIVTVPLADLDF
jgi:hypothetical protein